MASVDERVVSLKFENRQFLNGIKSSINGLDGLNKGLSSAGNTRGLRALSEAVKNVDLKTLAVEADNAGKKLGVMATAAAVALGNLASKAITQGINSLKSFTVQPLIDGFREYELQLNSVQTILANTKSKGENLKTVTAALDELNLYADKTKYNFAEMTRNIGTFTAAGVGLDDSVAAIKGISNLAAASGANSQQAASAMYQLSQALSTGTVKLMDWNSVVNAGMGGEVFQEALKRTARVHGVAIDEIIAKNGSFRDSLQEGWLTSEILLETLTQMTGDLSDEQLRQMGYTEEQIAQIQQFAVDANAAATEYKTFSDVVGATMEAAGSGWANVFRILIGDFEEAKAMWTVLGNAIGDGIGNIFKGIESVAQSFVDFGGRTAIIQTFVNLFQILARPIKAVAEAFGSIFHGDLGKNLANVAKGIEKVTAAFVLSDSNVEKLKQTFEGIFSVINILLWPFRQAAKLALGLGQALLTLGGWAGGGVVGSILSLTSGLAKGPVALSEWLSHIDPVGKALKALQPKVEALAAFLGPKFSTAIEAGKKALEGIKDAVGAKLAASFSSLGAYSSELAANLGEKLGPKARAAADRIKELYEVFSGKLAEKFKQFIDTVKLAGAIFGAVFSNKAVVGTLDPLGAKIEKVAVGFHNVYLAVKEFADAVKSAVGSKITSAFGKLGDSLGSLFDSISGSVKNPFAGAAASMTASGDSIVASTKSTTDAVQSSWEGFKQWFTTNITPLFESLGKTVSKGVKAAGSKLKEFGQFLKGTEFSNTEGLGRVVNWLTAAGVGAIIWRVATAFKSAGEAAQGFSQAFQQVMDSVSGAVDAKALEFKAEALKKFAVAVAIMAAALFVLSLIDGPGLVRAGIALAMITGSMRVILDSINSVTAAKGSMAVAAAAAIGISFAVLTIAGAAKLLSTVNTADLIKGSIAVSVIIFALTKAMSSMSKLPPGAGAAKLPGLLSFLGIASAILLVGLAIKKLGELPISTLIKGGVAVGVIMGMLTIFENAVKNPLAFGSALALVAIAFALTQVAGQISELGSLPLLQAQQGVIILGLILGMISGMLVAQNFTSPAGALSILASIGILLTIGHTIEQLTALPWHKMLFAVVIIGLVLAELVVASSFASGGVIGAASILLMASALSIMSGVLSDMSKLSWDQLKVGLAGIGAALGIVIIAGYLASGAAVGLALLAASLAALGIVFTAVGFAATAVAAALTVMAAVGAPAFAALAAGITLLAPTIPVLVQAFIDSFILILQAIVDNEILITQAMTALVMAIATTIINTAPTLGEAMMALIDMLVKVIVAKAPDIAVAGVTLLLALMNVLIQFMPKLTAKGAELIVAFLRGIAAQQSSIINAAFDLIISFINGLSTAIDQRGPELRTVIKKLIWSIVRFVLDSWSDLLRAGGNIIDGIVQGISNKKHQLINKIKSIASDAWSSFKDTLGISSPSKVFAKGGKWIVAGAVKGITQSASTLDDAASRLGESAKNKFEDAVSGFSGDDFDLNPTIVPLVDMSKVDRAFSSLNGTPVNLDGNLNAIDRAQAGTRNKVSPGPEKIDKSTTVNFTQNNNSPKSLSEAEISKRTRSLLARLER